MQIAQDDAPGAISFHAQPLKDFAGNEDHAGTSEFTHGVPPRVEHV
jgi:hypothetical protein